MFDKKPTMEEGVHIFCSKPNGDFNDIIFGTVTGIDGNKIGVNGLRINPVGLKNKIDQGKAGQRSIEILQNPTPENCIFSLIYRVEQENYSDVLDLESDRVVIISPQMYKILDGWIRESLPDMFNKILSLPSGTEKEQAKRTLQSRMETLTNKHLKKNIYSVCRSLRILSPVNKNW